MALITINQTLYQNILRYINCPKIENKDNIYNRLNNAIDINTIQNIINIIDSNDIEQYIPNNNSFDNSNKILLCIKFPLLVDIYTNIFIESNNIFFPDIIPFETIEYDETYPSNKILYNKSKQYIFDLKLLLKLNKNTSIRIEQICTSISTYLIVINNYFLLRNKSLINSYINKINEFIRFRQDIDDYLIQYNISYDLILSWRDQLILHKHNFE